ncbi:hypothetical protein KKG61_06045, partial [bacterium]|nr:hypothetical protein [bacterium]
MKSLAGWKIEEGVKSLMIYSLIGTQGIWEVLVPFIILLTTLCLGVAVRQFLFSRLSRWSKNTKSEIDDAIITTIRGPFVIWCLMIGIYLALEVSKLPKDWVDTAGKAILVLGILSVTLVLANISARLVKMYSGKI